MTASNAHRFLDRSNAAETVTLRNYVEDGEDDHGENWVEAADSPKTVRARVVREARPNHQPSQRELAYVEADTSIYVKDTITGITDGGGDGASRVETSSHKYKVLDSNDQNNGLLELRCERLK